MDLAFPDIQVDPVQDLPAVGLGRQPFHLQEAAGLLLSVSVFSAHVFLRLHFMVFCSAVISFSTASSLPRSIPHETQVRM